MEPVEHGHVSDVDGVRGVIESITPVRADGGGGGEALVRLEDGRRLRVPADVLIGRGDGVYHLPFRLAEAERMAAGDEAVAGAPSRAVEALVVPVVAETLRVGKRLVETGVVRLHKIVREREEVVDEPILRDRVEVERVPVDRVVAEAPPIRHEGATTIIPVLEEVLVVEKRLMLKEEIRITRHPEQSREPQRVVVRSEEVSVERVQPAPDEAPAGQQPVGGMSEQNDLAERP